MVDEQTTEDGEKQIDQMVYLSSLRRRVKYSSPRKEKRMEIYKTDEGWWLKSEGGERWTGEDIPRSVLGPYGENPKLVSSTVREENERFGWSTRKFWVFSTDTDMHIQVVWYQFNGISGNSAFERWEQAREGVYNG